MLGQRAFAARYAVKSLAPKARTAKKSFLFTTSMAAAHVSFPTKENFSSLTTPALFKRAKGSVATSVVYYSSEGKSNVRLS